MTNSRKPSFKAPKKDRLWELRIALNHAVVRGDEKKIVDLRAEIEVEETKQNRKGE